jgi:hypothetical protein
MVILWLFFCIGSWRKPESKEPYRGRWPPRVGARKGPMPSLSEGAGDRLGTMRKMRFRMQGDSLPRCIFYAPPRNWPAKTK